MKHQNKAFIIILLFIGGVGVRAQTIQSRALSALQQALNAELEDAKAVDSVKCGTALITLAINNWTSFSTQTRERLQQSFQRQELQKSRLSPSGHFRIHYDTTGINAPALITSGASPQRISNSHEQYVDSVAAVFDYCWEVEVQTLGYFAPPSDGTQGGGSEFDIYIVELGDYVFGQTIWVLSDSIPSGSTKRFPTFIEIDNTYIGHRTKGINGVKVTAAHEFFHAIQIGGYGYWQISNADPSLKDRFFFELSSGWMEDVVYTEINDSYYDIEDFFEGFRDALKRSYSLVADNVSSNPGYERSVWAHFLTKRFGRDIMKELWTGIISAPFFESMSRVLEQRGTDFATEYALFSYWNYFTADRADTARYYPEGAFYPRFSPNVLLTYNGFQTSTATSGYPLSTQLIQIVFPSDTATAVITNADTAGAQDSTLTTKPFGVRFSSEPTTLPYQNLSNGAKAGVSANLRIYKFLFLNSSTRSNASVAMEASPNPFRLREARQLVLPVSGTRTTEAEVIIFSISLDRVLTQRYPILESFGKRYIAVPSKDLLGRASSGIYFIYAQCDDAEFHWKVAIVQ